MSKKFLSGIDIAGLAVFNGGIKAPNLSNTIGDIIVRLADDTLAYRPRTSLLQDIATGTTSQYVRGDGSLASFPTLISASELSTGTATSSRLISAQRLTTWVNSLGFLTSYTETDPTVPTHVKEISVADKNSWNQAYSWGDHAGLYAPNFRDDIVNGVDGVHNYPNQWKGIGISTYTTGSTGSPSGSSTGVYWSFISMGQVTPNTSGYSRAFDLAYNGSNWFLRGLNVSTGVANSWNTLWHSGNFNPASKSDSGHTHTFASLSERPTTIAGYGITDNLVTATLLNGYWGMTVNGSATPWVRTSSSGLLPYASGGSSSIGTSSWPFNAVYANNLYQGGSLVATQAWVTSKNYQPAGNYWNLGNGGYYETASTFDLNNSSAGNYGLSGSQVQNIPFASAYSWVLTSRQYGADDLLQVNYPFRGMGSIAWRNKQASGWSPWVKVWDEKNDGSGSGLDADMVDGIESSRIIYGDDERGTIRSTTPNQIAKSGFYFMTSGYSGNPVASSAGHLIHANYDTSGSYGFQIWSNHSSDNFFMRRQSQDGTAWRELWHTGNFNPSDYATNASLSSYVSKWETWQGDFKLTGDALYLQSSKRFLLHNGSTFIGDIDNAGGSLYIRRAGVNEVVMTGNSTTFLNKIFAPSIAITGTDATVDSNIIWHAGNHRSDSQNDGRFLPQGGYSFVPGYLIATDIPADEAKMFVLRVLGNGYSGDEPFNIVVQGYNYPVSDGIVQVKGHSTGANPTISIFNYNGFLYFHMLQTGNYQTPMFWVYSGMDTPRYNRITGVGGAAIPSSGVTRLVNYTPKKVWTANEISEARIDMWNNSYSWGDHAGKYLPVNASNASLTSITTGVNLDAKNETYMGVLTSAVNTPNQTAGFMISSFAQTGSGVQIWNAHTQSDAMYFRHTSSGNMGAWYRIASREWASGTFQPIGSYASAEHIHYASDITVSGGNWDTYTENRFGLISGSANGPSGTLTFIGATFPNISNQYATSIAGRNGAYYLRSLEAGIWGNWNKIALESWVNDTFVPKVGASYIQSSGKSTSWGTTSEYSTGAFNALMGTGAAATWLLSGTSGGNFRAGIQVLDSGGMMRIYLGSSYMQFDGSTLSSVALNGNASTATKLQAARTINGTAFDGTANIVTERWGVGRNLTIGSKTNAVTGLNDVVWTLADIGAQPIGSYADSAHTHPASEITAGAFGSGSYSMTGNLTLGGILVSNSTASRDKLRVWNSSTYTIGMMNGFSFGGLANDYAMTFQMNNQSTRGFWWGSDTHTNLQGAMALTTQGKLTVADSVRLGYGISDNVVPGTNATLDVNGSISASGFKTPTGTSSQFLKADGSVDSASYQISGSYLRSNTDDTFTGKLSVASTSSRDAGMYGFYESSKIGHIWSMGATYSINSTGTSLGNLYGMAYGHNNSGLTPQSGHQTLFVNNGTVGVSIRWDIGVVWTKDTGDSYQWNAAYSWGNHATAGYLTSESSTLSNVLGRGNTAANEIILTTIGTNTAVDTDSLKISGYGLMGNRASLYFTNNHATGNIRFGIGGTHNAGQVALININGLEVTGTIKRTGGLSTQFLKADGSVDSTSYQPAGNYSISGHSHSSIDVKDVRVTYPGNTGSSTSYAYSPTEVNDKGVTSTFAYIAGAGASWRSALTVKGWAGSTYAAWELIGPASQNAADDDYYLRSGVGASWNTPVKVWHSGNFNPANFQASGDYIPYGSANALVRSGEGLNFDNVPNGNFISAVNTGGTSNAPNGFNGGGLIRIMHSGTHGGDLLIGRDPEASYLRGNNSSGWSAWKQIATREWANTQFALGSHTHTKSQITDLEEISYDVSSHTIPKRNASGDLFARLYRTTYSDQSSISGAMAFRINNGSDNYIRFCNSPSAIRSFLDVPATAHSHEISQINGLDSALSEKASLSHTHAWGAITDKPVFNNKTQRIQVDAADLSGTGSIEAQVAEYINANYPINRTEEHGTLFVEVTDYDPGTGGGTGVVPTTGLKLYYNFEGVSDWYVGTGSYVKDYSPESINGLLYGGAAWTDGGVGGYMPFDSANSRWINTQQSYTGLGIAGQEHSLVMVVRFSDLSDWVRVFGAATYSGVGTSLQFGTYQGNIQYDTYGSAVGTPTGVLTTGVWAHISMSQDSTGMIRLYLNGTEVANGNRVFLSSDTGVYFARWVNSYATFDLGLAMVYNRAITAVEANDIYLAQKTRFGI